MTCMDTHFVTEALKQWNSEQPAHTKILRFDELSASQRSWVLALATELKSRIYASIND